MPFVGSQPSADRAGLAPSQQSPLVLHVVPQVSDQGGAEVSLVQFVSHLQSLGVRNALLPLYSRRTSERLPQLREAGVHVFDPIDQGPLRRAAAVRRAVGQLQPDVVHSSVWDADVAAHVGCLGLNVVRVVSLVNTPYAPEAIAAARSPRRLEIYRRTEGVLGRRLTDQFHAITGAVADSAVQSLGIDRNKIRVIPRGRDRQTLGHPSAERRSHVRAQLSLSEDAEVVLNVARQEPQKGLVHLLRAFNEIAAERPRAVLLQAGREGSATAELKDEIAKLGLGDRVWLLGRRTDVGDLLAACDVFAFSSLWEGLGGAVLEAMAMDAPVVAFGVPAVREVLGDAAEICALGDTDGFAKGLRRLLEDRAAAAQLAASARQRFEDLYTIEAVADQMAEFYRSLVGEKR